jgi:hypothetical protein
VIHSKLGYVVNPQAYIVGAVLKGNKQLWTIDTSTFSHSLTVNFIEVLPDDLLDDATFTSGLLPKLPADLFYPLSVVSDSSRASNLFISLLATLAALFLFLMF